jgi:choline dehydrogenase-like flavoprotein
VRQLLVVDAQSEKKRTGKVSAERRFYLCSHDPTQAGVRALARYARDHWGGVEIRNHWRHDALWSEDKTLLRTAQARVNLCLLRHFVRTKALRAGYSNLPELFAAARGTPWFGIRLLCGDG